MVNNIIFLTRIKYTDTIYMRSAASLHKNINVTRYKNIHIFTALFILKGKYFLQYEKNVVSLLQICKIYVIIVPYSCTRV